MGFQIENGVLEKYIEEGVTDVVIPEGVTTIGEQAFYSCKSLTNVTIPKSVTTIGYRAFEKCESLTSVTIPEGVTTIGHYAFGGCELLESVTISNYTVDNTYLKRNKVEISNVISMIVNRDYTVAINHSVKYSIVTGVFLKNSQPEAEAYIKKNALKIIRHFIDLNDYATVKGLLESDKFVNKENIDKLIDHAIASTQNDSDTQIQVLLTNYKNEKFGTSNSIDKLKL